MATRKTSGTRARDSDRNAICQILDAALADGQLSGEEHRQRVSAATNAATLGELEPLTADLQIPGAVQPFAASTPKLGRRPLVLAGLAVAAIVLVVAVAVILMTNDSTPDTTPTPSATTPETHELAAEPSSPAPSTEPPADPAPVVLGPPPNLHTADGLTLVLDEIRRRFGDTTGYELAIMSDEALLARPDPTDDSSKLVYTFERGWGDPSSRPRSDTDDVTDLGAFDVQAAAAALQAAPETLRIAPDEVSETFIDVDHIAEPPEPGALELLVKVSTKSGADGWIYLDPAGNIKRVEYPS